MPVIALTVDCVPCPTTVVACPMAMARAFNNTQSPTTGHDGGGGGGFAADAGVQDVRPGNYFAQIRARAYGYQVRVRD